MYSSVNNDRRNKSPGAPYCYEPKREAKPILAEVVVYAVGAHHERFVHRNIEL